MFPYQDPVETDLLARHGALEAYRSQLQVRYTLAANEPGTNFQTLDRFGRLKAGRTANSATLLWEAFPIKQSGFTDSRIDRDRPVFQEEYVEWNFQVAADGVKTLSFTTEFPEYLEALANVSFDALVAGIREIIPDANPTAQELLGVKMPLPRLSVDGVVGPQSWTMLNRVSKIVDRSFDQPILRRGARGRSVVRLQERLQLLGLLQTVDGDFGPMTERAVMQAQRRYTGSGHLFKEQLRRNPWNDGSKGICCMFQSANTLPFLFDLVAKCSVPRSINPRRMCELVSPNCVPGRNSDPIVCSAAQRQVQNGSWITLKDPAGIQIQELKGRWRLNGTPLDINDPAQNQGIWQVSRGGRRGVLRLLPGLEVDSAEVRTGAQIARKLMVGADVLVAPASDFSP